MSDVSCVIFYAGGMLQTIEFPWVALNINLFEGPLFICIVRIGRFYSCLVTFTVIKSFRTSLIIS
jgi:hypothetical protein